MKISELLRYQQAVSQALESGYQTTVSQILESMMSACVDQHYTEEPHPRLTQAQTEIRSVRGRLGQDLDHMQSRLRNLHDTCEGLISSLHQDYINRSGKLYSRQYNTMTAQDVFDRSLPLTADQISVLRSRMAMNCAWTDSALLIRPGQQPWIADMSSANLLYVWDHDDAMLAPALAAYPDRLNGRIRVYTGSDRTPFTMLPTAQMGMILALGFFEYKPLDIVCHYVTEFHRLLRPGGMALFSFNDGDTVAGAEFAEQNYRCYTPGTLIQQRARELGLETQELYHGANGVSWLQVQRPGQYRNLMGAPVLTKIHARSK